jgi:hypothetical protein
MKETASHDLPFVRGEFEAWRARRNGRGRIPETLWAAAIKLLDRYPLNLVSRELRLSPTQLRQRRAATSPKPQPRRNSQQTFLELTPHALTPTKVSAHSVASDSAHLLTEGACRIVLERGDGSRLSLTLPVDWLRIEALCASFLRTV